MTRSPLLLLLLLLPLLVGSAFSQQVNFVHSFSGGLPFCSQCGAVGQYACSPDANGVTLGNWNSGSISFTDPVPAGNYPTKLIVELVGSFSCNAANQKAMFAISLNDVTHSVKSTTKGANQCKCDTCDGTEVFTVQFRNGIPNYKEKATNILKILPYQDSLCLNRVNVTMEYAPKGSSTPLPENYMSLTIPKGLDRVNCPVCNAGLDQWCSAGYNNSFVISFKDPLPAGLNYLVSIDAYVSLNLVEKSYVSLTTLSAMVQQETIQGRSISEGGWVSKCGCLADYQFQSATYQRGWPNYVAGGTNKVTFTVKKYSESYGNVCLGRVGLKLVYFPAGREDLYETIFLEREDLKIEQ